MGLTSLKMKPAEDLETDTGSFEIFSWSSNFNTHISEIDEQHQRLVDLINELAYATTQSVPGRSISSILEELVDYANFHFEQEEAIWREHLSGDPLFSEHLETHAAFVEKITTLQSDKNDEESYQLLEEVLNFLVNWLAYHILDSDMHLAKTIIAIQNGMELEEAKLKSKEEMSQSRSLIESVLAMHQELSKRTLKLLREKQERQILHDALVASEARERGFTNSIMTSIPGLIYLIDENERLVRWNRKLNEITGYTDQELKCLSISDLTAEKGQLYRQTIQSKNFLAENYAEHEDKLVCRNGRGIPFLFTYTRLTLNGQNYFAGVGLDITSRKAAEYRLRESTDLYKRTERLTKLGHWKLDHQTGELDCSEETFRILGIVPPVSPITFDTLLNSIHPDDEETVNIMVFNSIRGKRHYKIVHRLVMPDGSIKYVRQQGYTDYHDNGKPAVTLGSMHDVTNDIHAKKAIEQKSEEARQALTGTIAAVARALEARDPYTAGHEQRVSDLAVVIAENLGLDKDRVEGIRLGASVHDLGKLAIPVELLTKPTRLSEVEFSLIKVHPTAGFEMLSDVNFPWPIKDIILQHHERLDGSGYPSGLIGEEISLDARIVAVADVFEAMSAHRPYRPALGMGPAIEELKRNRGKYYDSTCVDALLEWVEAQPDQL